MKILITGGSGLIGTRLTEMLLKKGHRVAHLGREMKKVRGVESYLWNIKEYYIQDLALEKTEVVVHLAGAGIADKRWTSSRKKVIRNSRIHSAELLHECIQRHNGVRKFISASGVSIYGDNGDEWLSEDAPKGNDFLADVAKEWEKVADSFSEVEASVTKFRIGVVLAENGGFVKEVGKKVKYGLAAPLGTGEQYISWVHIDDLCRLLVEAIETDNYVGSFNATAPEPATNKTVMKKMATLMHKPLWLPNVPKFMLRLMFGEMADALLFSQRASSKKVEDAGFSFEYKDIDAALENIFKANE